MVLLDLVCALQALPPEWRRNRVSIEAASFGLAASQCRGADQKQSGFRIFRRSAPVFGAVVNASAEARYRSVDGLHLGKMIR
ncbi:hypothetical protein [Litorivita sp. NS0012-18]|uniref:hypothetical protein n=1 Tax=Litorivita sp. NS0012-18 TaxID=3127655 RepID=UPI00333F954A